VDGELYYFTPGGFLYRRGPGTDEVGGISCGYLGDEVWHYRTDDRKAPAQCSFQRAGALSLRAPPYRVTERYVALFSLRSRIRLTVVVVLLGSILVGSVPPSPLLRIPTPVFPLTRGTPLIAPIPSASGLCKPRRFLTHCGQGENAHQGHYCHE